MNHNVARKVTREIKALGLSAIWAEGKTLSKIQGAGRWSGQCINAWRVLAFTPVSALLTTLCIGVAIGLFGVFLLFIELSGRMVHGKQSEQVVQAFLKPVENQDSIENFVERLKVLPEVKSVSWLSPEESLGALRKRFEEDTSLFEGLDSDNPLPHSVSVSLRDTSPEAYARFAKRLEGDALVEEVFYRKNLVRIFDDFSAMMQKIGTGAVIVLFLLAGFIVASTAKLALEAHCEEIQIMRLVGAEESYIVTPFVLAALLEGIVGGLLSLLFVYSVWSLLNDFFAASPFGELMLGSIEFLSLWSCIALMMSAMIVGVGGSYFTVRNFARTVE